MANRAKAKAGTGKGREAGKRSHHKKRAAVLPPPVEVNESANEPEPEPGGGGLLGFLGLGNKREPEPEPEPEAAAAEPSHSAGSFGGSFPEPLSAEAERILAGVPDVIGDGGAASDLSPEPIEPESAGAPLAISSGPVSPEMAGMLFRAVGQSLERWRKFEGRYEKWGEDTAVNAGASWAMVANTAWERYAPMLFKSAEGSFPGLTAALTITCVPLFLIALDDRMRAAAPVAVPEARRAPGGPSGSAVGPQVVNGAGVRPYGGGIVFPAGE